LTRKWWPNLGFGSKEVATMGGKVFSGRFPPLYYPVKADDKRIKTDIYKSSF